MRKMLENKDFLLNNKGLLLAYKGAEEDIVLPETIDEITIREIGPGAFEENKSLRKISLPQTVKKIGEGAFSKCPNLKEVILADGISSLPENVFSYSRVLEKVHLPENLEIIPALLFAQAPIKEIFIGKRVKEIRNRAFNSRFLERVTIDPNNPYLKSDGLGIYSKNGKKFLSLLVSKEDFSLPDTVEKIGNHAFENSGRITRVKLSKNLKIIEDHAFFSTDIKEINLPEGLVKIGKEAFKYCRNLKELSLPRSLRIIGGEAFNDSGLTEITIPEKVEKIGLNAFTIRKNEIDTRGLKDFKVDPNNKTFSIKNKGLFYHTKRGSILLLLIKEIGKTYEIPQGTKFLADNLFSYHTQLEEVVLPEGLEEIGDFAFYYSGLTKLDLPESVKIIGDYAFYQTRIRQVFIPKNVEKIGKSALNTKMDGTGDRFLEKIELDEYNRNHFIQQNALFEKTDKGISLIHFFGIGGSFYLPKEATIIKEGAFTDSSVEEVFFHRDIEKIEKDAFLFCKALRRAVVELKNESLCSEVTLYFPTLDMVYEDINSYMNCIYYDGQGEVIDFERYDSFFPIIREWDEKIQVALSRLETPCSINPQGEAVYKRFLLRNFKNIYKRVIDWENIPGLEILLDLKKPSREVFEKISAYGRSSRSPKVIAFLLEYSKEKFPVEEEDYEL